jgi:hypothetical protein
VPVEPPSVPHAPSLTVSQLKSVGQSAFCLHSMIVNWQDDVVAVVQEGSGGAGQSAFGGQAGALPVHSLTVDV